MVCPPGRTLIQGHHHIRFETRLDLDCPLRREQVRRAVDVTLEGHTFVRDAIDPGQREDLESPGVREDRPVPVHEPAETTSLLDHLRARSKIEMVGISKQDAGSQPLEVFGRKALHGPLRANRHEAGGRKLAVAQPECPGPGPAVRAIDAITPLGDPLTSDRSGPGIAHRISIASP